jgi:biotin synthase
MSSASPFIPAPGTPLRDYAPGSVELTLNTIAVMRLVHPPWLIPSVSALEKLQRGGQRRGLEAGANVLTVNFTPATQRDAYQIYGRDRYIVGLEHVKDLISSLELRPSQPLG